MSSPNPFRKNNLVSAPMSYIRFIDSLYEDSSAREIFLVAMKKLRLRKRNVGRSSTETDNNVQQLE